VRGDVVGWPCPGRFCCFLGGGGGGAAMRYSLLPSCTCGLESWVGLACVCNANYTYTEIVKVD